MKQLVHLCMQYRSLHATEKILKKGLQISTHVTKHDLIKTVHVTRGR